MNKKAQLTIFIIVALFIIAGVALFLTFRKNTSENLEAPAEVAPVYNFVQECLEETAEKVIYDIGQGGGHYFPPEKATYSGIPYYLIKGENYMPKEQEVENEISKFVSERLFFCIKNFVNFKDYEIQQGKINSDAEISEGFVTIKTNYPLTISKGESSSRIEDFEVKIPVRLGTIYNSIKEFLENTESGICLSCLYEISEKEDLFIDMFDYGNSSVIFIFKDENSELNGNKLEWVFTNEY